MGTLGFTRTHLDDKGRKFKNAMTAFENTAPAVLWPLCAPNGFAVGLP